MEPTKETSPKRTAKRWSKKWWLGVGGAALVTIGGLVSAVFHKAAEKVGEAGVEKWLAASKDDNPPHMKVVGDWCVLESVDGGSRLMMNCFTDAMACAKHVKNWTHLIRPITWECVVVPMSTPLWCTTKVVIVPDWPDARPWDSYDSATLCFFDADSCKQHGFQCFPTTKAALAQ